MSRAKVFASISMILILIALSGISVWAAPGGQEPVPMLDPTEEPPPEPTEEPLPEPTEEPLPEPTEEPEEPAEHPVASALAEYFASLIPELEYDTIMGRHEDGFGFGVIAQACWMSLALQGDAGLLGEILDAKKSHDFSEIDLSSLGVEGENPTNWGQFRKVVFGSEKHKNLGAIMSGRDKGDEDEDETGDDEELGTTSTEGKVKGKKGKGPGEDGPPGQNKDKDGGKPDTPPGQKNKGGGKGGGKKK